MTDRANITPLRRKRACPECGKPSAREVYPFCSTRCKDVDLNRWLTGRYVIPGRDGEADDVDAQEEHAKARPSNDE